FNSIRQRDSVNNHPQFCLPIGVFYVEGTVNGQIVDRNPDLAETFIRRLAELPKAATQKEVKKLVKLWGEVYLPWINSSQGWMHKKKEQATELIIAECVAEVIAQVARMLELTPQGATSGKGKEKVGDPSLSPKPRRKAQGESFAFAYLPPTDLKPEDDLTVECKEDNNTKGPSKSSEEETDATLKQKKQRKSRKPINPLALSAAHLVGSTRGSAYGIHD
ncbi:hypothetical protein HDU93_008283, partial [Gonapodya sp. JEL0774]